MKKRFLWVTCILLISSSTIISWKAETAKRHNKLHSAKKHSLSAKELFSEYIDEIYNTAQLHEAGLDYTVFQKAITGYFNLKAANQVPQTSSVITIVDLAKSSCTKRMWVVDLIDKQLLIHALVAHGNGSGYDVAEHFSNETNSYASSLGFYITDGTYIGKHGRSLKLDGLDAGFNDNARSRGIVIHGAPYVSEKIVDSKGRLGRSEGCPAVSPKVIKKVIETIKGKTVLFINGNDYTYNSKYLDQEGAAKYVYPDSSSSEVNASL
ncbi:MAG: murein L,D-transpeptidase catalytic domain family protein [Sphingobacteriales bacterium]